MKRILLPFAMLISGLFLFVSCLDDDNELVYADDTAITSFTLGTLNQYIHTISSKGLDSVYRREVDCSKYKFYIDQVKCEIYNTDSLPYGIDNKKVLCTIMAKNYGAVGVKSMTSDSLSYHVSTDSIDFSSPRDFYIYSSSGVAFRKYTVRVNVHQEEADSFRWNRMATVKELAELKGMRAVTNTGQMFVFGTDGMKTLIYRSADGKSWTDITPSTGDDLSVEAYKNIVTKGGLIYLYDNGLVKRSTDGASWNVSGRTQLRQLVAASRSRLYAYDTNGQLTESVDDGATWKPSLTDELPDLLPTEDVTYVCVPLVTNKDADRVVIIGNRNTTAYPGDVTPQIWSKIDETSEYSEDQPWIYYDVASDNNLKAPHLRNMQTVSYDNCILAIGGDGIGGDRHKAFDGIYHSADGGITWKKNLRISLPSGFTADQNSFALLSDSDNFLWLICGGSGHVWRVRINRLGWNVENGSFIE